MLTKLISTLLVGLMISFTSTSFALGQNTDDKIQERAAKVKSAVNELGVDEASKVTVKFWNKKKIKGYITEITDDSFTVVDKQGNKTLVKFTEAKLVKGSNVPAGVWIAVGVGAGLGVFGLALLYAISKN